VHTRTKSPEPVVRKLNSPRIFFLSKEGPNSVIPKALVAVTVAMSALPCARAETILIMGSNSPLEDEGFFWAQVFRGAGDLGGVHIFPLFRWEE
jgi:hypothetical protein